MADEVKKQMNPKLIAAFVNSTQNVLKTMVQVDSKIGKPSQKFDPQPSYDVSGIVGFSGEVVGSVVISFREQSALNIVEAFCGEKLDLHNEDFADMKEVDAKIVKLAKVLGAKVFTGPVTRSSKRAPTAISRSLSCTA